MHPLLFNSTLNVATSCPKATWNDFYLKNKMNTNSAVLHAYLSSPTPLREKKKKKKPRGDTVNNGIVPSRDSIQSEARIMTSVYSV